MIKETYNSEEYYRIAKPILDNEEFQKRKLFLHHDDSVYDHSLSVSLRSYKMAVKLSRYFNISVEDVIIGSLLHDFYTTPWRENKNKSKNLFKAHGFTHAGIACQNSYDVFPEYMNKKTENIIKRHMFPLNVIPPKYIESWIVTAADKYVSMEVMKHPKNLPRYVGLTNPHLMKKSKKIYNLTKGFVTNMY